MKVEFFDSQLSQFETQLALLSAALVGNDSAALVAAAGQLQSMTVQFTKVLQQANLGLKDDPSAQARVKKIGAALRSLREGLLRRSVSVERALAALLPAAQADTYAPKARGYGQQPYGSAGRQSGEFRVLAA